MGTALTWRECAPGGARRLSWEAMTGRPLPFALRVRQSPFAQGLETYAPYLRRLAAVGCLLEVELGVSGELYDNLDHTSAVNSSLFTQADEIRAAYEALQHISPLLILAPACGSRDPVCPFSPEVLAAGQSACEGLQVLYAARDAVRVREDLLNDAITAGLVKVCVSTEAGSAYVRGLQAQGPFAADNLRAVLSRGEEEMTKSLMEAMRVLRSAGVVVGDEEDHA